MIGDFNGRYGAVDFTRKRCWVKRFRTRRIGGPSPPSRKRPPRLRGYLENIVGKADRVGRTGGCGSAHTAFHTSSATRPGLPRVLSGPANGICESPRISVVCSSRGPSRPGSPVWCAAHRIRCCARTRVVLLGGLVRPEACMVGGETPPGCIVEWHESSSGQGGG